MIRRTTRRRPDSKEREIERHVNGHGTPKAANPPSSTVILPRPNEDSRCDTYSSRRLKAQVERDGIQIIPVAVTSPPEGSTLGPESRASSAIPHCVARGSSNCSLVKPSLPVRTQGSRRNPISCLELARARAFQDGVLPVHQFAQVEQISLESGPNSLAAREHAAHPRLNNPSVEAVESMYANIGQPVPNAIKHQLGENGPPRPKQINRRERRDQDANEELHQKMQSNG